MISPVDFLPSKEKQIVPLPVFLHKRIAVACVSLLPALAILLLPTSAYALDVGFEGLLRADASDNVEAATTDTDAVREGSEGFAQFGIFGEQRGRGVSGAFSGEIESRRQFDEDDPDVSTLTRFLGAANFSITPRSLSWYVGDVLGNVRQDNSIQQIDDSESTKRNVFITGPSINFTHGAVTRSSARLLYVNQSEDDVELESLYNASFRWERSLSPDSAWGLRVNDIFTDNPEDSEDDDFNRVSLAGYWNRTRGLLSYEAEIGGTRYDTEDVTLDGANALFRLTRRLNPQQKITGTIGQDLRDQTINTVQSLIDNEGNGLEPEADGFFEETLLEARYTIQSSITTTELGARFTNSDYRLLANQGNVIDADFQDQWQASVFGYLSRSITPRLRTQLGLSFEQQRFQNTDGESDSILASVELRYRLSRSFALEAGYRYNQSEGLRVTSGVEDAAIDAIENRVSLGLRWAPPTRASKDLTIELKSLLQ